MSPRCYDSQAGGTSHLATAQHDAERTASEGGREGAAALWILRERTGGGEKALSEHRLAGQFISKCLLLSFIR